MKTCALVIACALLVACGKKGPPLLPYVHVPVAAEIASARRIGSDVYVTVAVPTSDIDEATPASVREIEVWAVTASAAPPASLFLSIATKVATIPVARYPDPSDTSETVVPDPKTGALQGTVVTIREPLTKEQMVARELPAPKTARPATTEVRIAETRPPEALRRFYMTVPFGNRRDRPGPPSKIVDVPMVSVPDRITDLRVAQKGRNIVLDWGPSGGLLGWLVDRALQVETAPVDQPATAATSPAAPAGPVRYNVYREIAADPLVLPPPTVPDSKWASAPESPVNAQPLTTLTFTEEVPFDERRRCYQVRAVRGSDAQRVESEASARECLVPVDTEPPVAVTGLTATPVEGSITLRWEPNGEEDLRGYLVLRRDPGDDTLHLLTRGGPIADTRYTDSTVMSGGMYTYVVQAVDNRIPAPNVSDPAETTATAP